MIGHHFMAADIPLRALYARLRHDFDNISLLLTNAINGLDASAVVVRTLAQMLAATTTSLPQSTVLVIGDANGNNGLFAYDSTSNAIHNGYDCIVDADGRRWIRKQGVI